MLPSEQQAYQFATMLSVGMPSQEAIRYFIPGDEEWTESSIGGLHDKWMRSRLVKQSLTALQGKSWEQLNLEERMRFSLDKHYGEMAYFLYSHHYSTLNGPDKAKADTARVSLEAKLAGTAGQLDPLEQFWGDLKSGKIKLSSPAAFVPSLPAPPPES